MTTRIYAVSLTFSLELPARRQKRLFGTSPTASQTPK